jgi:cell division protein FtsQ
MDGGGRLDQSVMRSGPAVGGQVGARLDGPTQARWRVPALLPHWLKLWRGRRLSIAMPDWLPDWMKPLWRRSERWLIRIVRLPVPHGVGVAASLLLLVSALGYGVVVGGHLPAVLNWAGTTRDAVADAFGFRIAEVSLSGAKEISREEILTTIGVTGQTSLLFLNADAARARLMANPWVADAAVLKLYPNRLQITITERRPFALWQKDGDVEVIADDGTVLEHFVERRYVHLPFVVGKGAQRRARAFLDILDRYPDIASRVRASVLVARRRWDLLLKNGIDVELPEANPAVALNHLVALDREKKLLTRDITVVDLRLPDRVTVRLSDAAAQARAEALKEYAKKKKGGDA